MVDAHIWRPALPYLMDAELYAAAYGATVEALKAPITQQQKNDFRVGDHMYRYSSAKYSNGDEAGVRKIWSELSKDVGNRWTGSDLKSGGVTGLYLALGQEGDKDTIFSELYHYQAQETDSGMTGIEYLVFHVLKPQIRVAADAKALHYMFNFSICAPVTGIDLRLYAESSADSFVSKVYKLMNEKFPKFRGQSLESLYMANQDASFCRGIGNACLSSGQFHSITVTSARNRENANVIIRGDGGKDSPPLPMLKAAGRSSFYLDEQGARAAVETLADQAYNDKIWQVHEKQVNGIVVTEVFRL